MQFEYEEERVDDTRSFFLYRHILYFIASCSFRLKCAFKSKAHSVLFFCPQTSVKTQQIGRSQLEQCDSLAASQHIAVLCKITQDYFFFEKLPRNLISIGDGDAERAASLRLQVRSRSWANARDAATIRIHEGIHAGIDKALVRHCAMHLRWFQSPFWSCLALCGIRQWSGRRRNEKDPLARLLKSQAAQGVQGVNDGS